MSVERQARSRLPRRTEPEHEANGRCRASQGRSFPRSAGSNRRSNLSSLRRLFLERMTHLASGVSSMRSCNREKLER